MSLLIVAVFLDAGPAAGPQDAIPRSGTSSSSRRTASKLLALASLALWVSIVFAGRWIAYFDANA